MSIEIACFIVDMQDLEARACQALHSNGISLISLKDETIFTAERIPADSSEFLWLMRRKHHDRACCVGTQIRARGDDPSEMS